MGQNKKLFLVAGAALTMTGAALAQGPGGFTMSDQNGDNSLTIGGDAHIIYSASFRDSDVVGDADDLTQGFGNIWTRFRFSGHLGSKKFGYKVQISSATFDDGSFSESVDALGVSSFQTDDCYGTWDFGNGWNFRFGQFNLPGSRDTLMGAEGALGSGMTATGGQYFGQGYSQGLQFGYTDEQIRFTGAWSDGVSTANTPFNTEAADYGLSFRVEGLVNGSGFDRFGDYSSPSSTQGDNVLVGAALHYEDGGETGGTITDYNLLAYTIDAQWEGPGYGVAAAFYGSSFESGSFKQDDFGFMAQGSYFFNETIEGFARYDLVMVDSDVAGSADENVGFIFAGVNCYPFVESTAVKFTAQVGYSMNDNSALGGSIPFQNGFLGQSTDGEIAFQFGGRFIF